MMSLRILQYFCYFVSDESMSTVNTSSFHSLAEEANFNSNIAASGHPSGSSIVSNGRLPEGSSVGDASNYYSVLAERPSTTDDDSELVVATSTPIRRRDIINATEDDFNRSPIKSMTQL